MKIYKKNKKKLIEGKVYDPSMEHEACGVGLIATTNGQKSREVVEHGIKALKAVWHLEAQVVDADGKSGDGAGIKLEISPDFSKIKLTKLVILMMIQKESV